ncbi:MAG TPA: CrcB family protein [Candidatus Dormibacteraeota bacterium]|nr:CrcB family protein [Candidatus Dormibacteraeota bacterium]
MTGLVAVAVLGAAGAVARFRLDGFLRPLLRADLPLPTLVINVAGSLAIGLITGLGARGLPETAHAAAATGFCGGFTTMSAASFEVVRLVERGERARAALSCVGMLVLCCGAAAVGLAISGG